MLAETEAVNWQEKVSSSPAWLSTRVLMPGSDGGDSCSVWPLRSMPSLVEVRHKLEGAIVVFRFDHAERMQIPSAIFTRIEKH